MPREWISAGDGTFRIKEDGLAGPLVDANGLTVQPKPGMFGQGGYLQTGAQGLQALSGLASAYTGLQNLGLAKKQFGFEKALTNRNIANQGQVLNEQYQNAGEVGLALAGNTMTPADRVAREAQIKSKYVNTSPIG